MPSLAVERPNVPRLPRLADGRHLRLPGDDEPGALISPVPRLSTAALVELVQDVARRDELDVHLRSVAPPLLARGSAEHVAALRKVLDELDGLGRSLDVVVETWWFPGARLETARPDAQALAQLVGDAPPWATARVRSGEWAVLGERSATSFVASYGVEVAADSGVAYPERGTALTGRTVHVRACRAAGGARVHLEVFLDHAEPLEGAEFDPETPDLGVLHQPAIGVLQLAFSGAVPSGEALAASVTGTGLRGADGALVLRATASPTPGAGSWRLFDLALLETRVEPLPDRGPGAGLELEVPPDERRVLLESLPSSALAAEVEAARRSSADGPGRGWPLVAWSPALLLTRAESEPVVREAEALLAALEQERLTTRELVLERGELRALLPVAQGVPARLLRGVERPLLIDYDVQVAPEAWMPVPLVEAAFDGLSFHAHALGDVVHWSAWTARSEAGVDVDRDALRLARLVLPQRAFQGERGAARTGEDALELLPAGTDGPALRLSVGPR